MQTNAHLAAAVTTARELFWRKGYEDTSMAELVEATGMNRYALYTAFGGKLDLFLAALDSYHEAHKSVFLALCDNPDKAPLDAIRGVFEFSIREMAKRKTGCLLSNIAAETARHEHIVGTRIRQHLEEIRSAFIGALKRAEEIGDLNPATTPEDAARLLLTLILGSGAHARSGANEDEMLRTFHAAMDVISHPDKIFVRT